MLNTTKYMLKTGYDGQFYGMRILLQFKTVFVKAYSTPPVSMGSAPNIQHSISVAK